MCKLYRFFRRLGILLSIRLFQGVAVLNLQTGYSTFWIQHSSPIFIQPTCMIRDISRVENKNSNIDITMIIISTGLSDRGGRGGGGGGGGGGVNILSSR